MLKRPRSLRVTAQSPGYGAVPLVTLTFDAMSTGANDARVFLATGVPPDGVSGSLSGPRIDARAHGRDERIRMQSYYEGREFLYRLSKRLASEPLPVPKTAAQDGRGARPQAAGAPLRRRPETTAPSALSVEGAWSNRDGGIRTRDPLNPIQVRYRTALRPVRRQARAHTDRREE